MLSSGGLVRKSGCAGFGGILHDPQELHGCYTHSVEVCRQGLELSLNGRMGLP